MYISVARSNMKNLKRLIFGSGKLGQHLSNEETLCIPREKCDISDSAKIQQIFDSLPIKPEVVINCAAKTNLEFCEGNKDVAFQTNTVGVANLLENCAQKNIKFVHISSGCLFDGNDSISTEESIPTPAAWYTYTKKWADEYIENYGYENYLILRPRQMISAKANPTNMLTKFCNYKRIFVHKEPNSITCVEDFCDMLNFLVENNKNGIYNCCNDGVVTPYDIATGIKEYILPELEVTEASYEHTLTLQANKRVNTILSNDKLKEAGFTPRHAKDALRWCLENYE